MIACLDKQREGWGWEDCEMRQWNGLQVCRGAGVTCYYLEVNG